MKIILCGKGGCGKSTIATMLGNSFAAKNKNVLVVDTDESNYGLHKQMGLPLPEKLTAYFGGKRGAFKRMDDVGRLFDERMKLEDIPSEYLSGSGRLHLLAVGKIEEAGEGCACGMGTIAKGFLENLDLTDEDVVIIDTEAGVEHFGRGVDRFADVILMIIDPSFESIHLSEKVYEMGKAFEKPVYFILNKADEAQRQMMEEAIRDKEAIIGYMPMDTEVLRKGLKGEKLSGEFPEIEEIVQQLMKE